MHTVVLLRHGESAWNKENRFTGWVDVDLTERGREEAHEAGRLLKEGGYTFDLAYTSVLKRAIRTLWITLDDMDLMWVPVVKSWRLNERHYGALQGLNKAETAAKHGDDTGQDLASQLRHSAAAVDAGRSTLSGAGLAVRRSEAQPDSAVGVTERHGRAVPARTGTRPSRRRFATISAC